MDWRPVLGVLCLSPNGGRDRLQPHHDPTVGLSRYRKWMEGWMDNKIPEWVHAIKTAVHDRTFTNQQSLHNI